MIILVIGGSASGKSSFGEKKCLELALPVWYAATMKPFGEEGEIRIKRHRDLRKDKGFITVEQYTDIGSAPVEGGTVLLECVGNLTANEMYEDDGTEHDPTYKVTEGIRKLSGKCSDMVIITNDVAREPLMYDDSTNRYIEAMGRINMSLASMADEVYEVVCGIPLKIKGEC
ncbi:MAG: bifunctional adenosylcobinamide kinase/adenosylcobinamide-phosphate guanylyltransferase [Lachnospiraceae bacterium]|nr:bifunctional adenosylcobinamide kinase/adenosylcobinamide-phosphate guanylyltransferase [Lachnospiraceae bacterium]